MKFESAMAELEQIVKKMESGTLSLDESVALFDRGVAICKKCGAQLEDAKGKIVKLEDNLGKPQEVPFDAE